MCALRYIIALLSLPRWKHLESSTRNQKEAVAVAGTSWLCDTKVLIIAPLTRTNSVSHDHIHHWTTRRIQMKARHIACSSGPHTPKLDLKQASTSDIDYLSAKEPGGPEGSSPAHSAIYTVVLDSKIMYVCMFFLKLDLSFIGDRIR